MPGKIMNFTPLIEKIESYVAACFKRNTDPNLFYHNYHHTVNVVKRVKEIKANYPVSRTDSFVLQTAAWFHDVGQLSGTNENHEEAGASIMKGFFRQAMLPVETVKQIEQTILSTKIPHKPTSLPDEIICDADTYNLGTDEFPNTDALLKRECELRGLPTEDWDKKTLTFLLQHRYFTSYCQQLLNETKEGNVALVRERMIGEKNC